MFPTCRRDFRSLISGFLPLSITDIGAGLLSVGKPPRSREVLGSIPSFHLLDGSCTYTLVVTTTDVPRHSH